MFLSQQATVNAIMIASGAAIDAAAVSAGAAAGGAAKDAAPGVAAH
jgi:hypothetical protein